MHSHSCSAPDSSGQRALLLVEDHDSYRALVKKALECFLPGWQVKEACSVATATGELRDATFEVLICDMTLPDGSATDVIDQLPALSRQATRVVVFSNHTEAQIAPLRARRDIHGIITKDRGLKELAQMVEHVAAGQDLNTTL